MFGNMSTPFLLRLLLLLLLALASTSGEHITFGTLLTAGRSLDSVSSPSGDFAFGFFHADSNRFLLAVWFNSTSPKSVVWSANRNALLGSGATVHLTADGRLSLCDENGTETWTTPDDIEAVSTSVLDTGNLVLGGATGGVLWQSFDHPTDTLLPGQVLKADVYLRSQLTNASFSEGRFGFMAKTDGNLSLYPYALLTKNQQYGAYWFNHTSGASNELVNDANWSIYYNATANTIIVAINATSEYSSSANFYQRATLDPDGVFRQYVYPKQKSGGTWNVIGRVPDDICQTFVDKSESAGSGVCGYNSYCSSDDGQNQINCMCLPQYSFIDQDYKYKGCMPNFRQTCDLYHPSSFKMTTVENLDWWYFDYEYYDVVDEDECGHLCLEDCFCALAIYGDQYKGKKCFKKKLPLTHGQSGNFTPRKALVKVPKDSVPSEKVLEWLLPMSVVGRFLLGSSGFLNLILMGSLIAVLVCHRRNTARCVRELRNLEEQSVRKLRSLEELNLRVFSYEELKQATKEFKEELVLGRGGFGIVYKGELPSSNGSVKLIAVKKLDCRLLQMIDDYDDTEFTNEVRSIGQTYHKNLVRLIGYCHEKSERLLVYEYMSRGSLEKFLFVPELPPWEQRTSIAIGIARGLVYLHEECSAPIIHCDIKPENVLLDDNFTARISDFGIAKLFTMDQTRTYTEIKGTKGYIAPERYESGEITKKVDVYSFGVMLLEIVSCRKHRNMGQGNEALANWAYDRYREGRLELLLRNNEDDREDIERAERFVTVALWCIQEDPDSRPLISEVVQMLEGAIPVEELPRRELSNTTTTTTTVSNQINIRTPLALKLE